jgi:branched-chain amino acid transport system substrate-binding protein
MILAGTSLSLEGRFALQGRHARRGLNLWAAWVNKQGGLAVGDGGSSQRVSLLIYDDRSRIADAKENVERLLTQDRVNLLFGPYSSVLTLAVAPIADGLGKILWNHGGASDEIFAQGWRTLIGGSAPASTYFADLPRWLRRKEPEIEQLTIVHAERGGFPVQVASGLAEAAKGEGFRQIVIVSCDLGSLNPSEIFESEFGWWPQALALVGSFEDEVRLILKREEFPRQVRHIAAVAAGLTTFGEVVGDRSEGILGSSQWEPGLGDHVEVGPEENWLLSSFRSAFARDPEYPAVQAFALGVVAAECLRRAGTLQDKAVRAAAASLDITTCFGKFRIDPETGRQVGHRPVLVEWWGGRKRVVWPPLAG